MLRERFGVARQADAPEFEQGKIRLTNGLVIALYFLIAFAWDGRITEEERRFLGWYVLYYVLGVALLAWMVLRPGTHRTRRWCGAILDVGATSAGMILAEEIATVVYGMYLWVVMGNGFRFGRRQMHGVQVLAVAGFAAVLLFSDYWRRNMTLGIGLMFALVAVPWYVSQLLERLQQARAEAVAANVAKTKFLAAASHDLRQPMQALSMYTSVLHEQVRGPATQRVLRGIELSVSTLEQLFDSLLDISKLESGVIKPAIVDFPLGPLIEHVVEAERPLAEQKGLELRVVRTAAGVRSDPALLARMLKNLVTNAIRYTERGGLVVGCRRRGGRVHLEVVDSGIGIAVEEQRRIFDEYYQLSGKSAQGLGLGLPIVRSLGELLGHRVTVRSAPGRGSVFSIELEPVAVAAEASAPVDTGGASLAGMTVVVVDDEAEIRNSMRLLLDGWGCAIIVGATLAEVEQELERGRLKPDAVIADYRLADGSDGAEVVARLRSRFGEALPAFIVTGTVHLAALRERAPGIPVAMKPVPRGKLRAFLSEAAVSRAQRAGGAG